MIVSQVAQNWISDLHFAMLQAENQPLASAVL
jgi:hypothetical protein